jgi:hypothetical protein
MPKWLGPFKIVREAADTAYKLGLPTILKLHDVFYMSLLKPYRSDGTVQPPPPALTSDCNVEWEVDILRGHCDRTRGRGTRQEYLVHWKGFDTSHDTRDPEAHLVNAASKVQAYLRLTKEQAAADIAQEPR